MKKTIFFTHNKNDFDFFFDKHSLLNLRKDVKILYNPLDKHLNDEEILKYSEDASIIISEWWTGAGPKLFKNKKDLKAIIRSGVEIKNIDFKAAKKANVAIINIPDAYSNAVAELVICFICSLARNLLHFHQKTMEGFYNEAVIEMLSDKKIHSSQFPEFEIQGSTLGVIGFGSIGQLIRKKAISLGMKVLVYDPFCLKKDKKSNFVSLDFILKHSRFVSLSASSNNKNKYLISKKELKKMSKNSYLINTARGNLVDTHALYTALKNNEIAGAAIDVLETSEKYDRSINQAWKHSENFSKTPLRKLKNVILTPHMAGYTKKTITKQSNEIIRNINLLFNNKMPKSILNKKKQ